LQAKAKRAEAESLEEEARILSGGKMK